MKKPSEDLFHLIDRMSRSERRYFTLFASQSGGEKKYLRLFEAISRQKEYDEEGLVREFEGDPLVRNLSYTKNYLYNLILKALRVYHADISLDAQLYDLLRTLEILYDKQLFDQCFKLLERGKSMIESSNNHLMELTLSHWENVLLRRTLQIDRLEEFLDEEREFSILERYRNFLGYARLGQRMFVALRRDTGSRDAEGMKRFDAILGDRLLQDESLALTFEARAHFHDLHRAYAQVVQDVQKDIEHCRRLVELLEEHPERIASLPRNYAAALTNLAAACVQTGDSDELGRTLTRLRELPASLGKSVSADERRGLETYVRGAADNLQISSYTHSGLFEEGIEVVGEIAGSLSEIEPKVSPTRLNDYWFNLAVFYFGLHDFGSALDWVNRLLNLSSKKIQQDLYTFARLFYLIIQIELGNVELLENGIRSLRRYLQSRDRLYRFEEAFLAFLRELLNAIDHDAEIEAFWRMQREVDQLKDDPFESRVLQFFDIEAWLRSRLEGRRYAEIVREEFLSNLSGRGLGA